MLSFLATILSTVLIYLLVFELQSLGHPHRLGHHGELLRGGRTRLDAWLVARMPC